MAAPKGNQFWKAAKKPFGVAPKYTAKALYEEALKYFEWVADHPLLEEKAFKGKDDDIIYAEVDKVRTMTLRAFCAFAGIQERHWRRMREKGDKVADVCQWVETVIYDWKMTNAAAGLLNSTIMVRELGLVDKTEVEHDVNDEVSELLQMVSKKGKKIHERG